MDNLSLNYLAGLVTLGGSILVSRGMYKTGRKSLSTSDTAHLQRVLTQFRYYQIIPAALFAVYILVRYLAPHLNLANVLFLWTSYNIFLWLKMRWIMKAFRLIQLPTNFQTTFIFSQIIAYTGLVSAMLILFRGQNL